MIIGFTGRIAAGKETIKSFLVDKGFEYIETSEVLREELNRRRMEITRKNMQDLGDELRKKQGPGILMKLLLEKADSKKNYIFDSLRNAGEVDFLRKNVKDFILIAVDAPRELRFKRILQRGKASDPKTWDTFLEVDNRDYFDPHNPHGQQVKQCIEKADYLIINDGSLEEIKKKIEKIYGEIKNLRT